MVHNGDSANGRIRWLITTALVILGFLAGAVADRLRVGERIATNEQLDRDQQVQIDANTRAIEELRRRVGLPPADR